jgi:4-amino-4-deoxy-L-arabinose transferase-like glycosyltransferase
VFDLIRRRPRAVVGVAATALLVRLAYVFGTSPRRLPFDDSLFYQVQSYLVAHGRGFVDPFMLVFQGRVVPTAGHPPLYPLFLAAGSVVGAKSILAHQIMGCVIGVGTVVGIGLIAAHIVSERAGLLAMAMAAIYPGLWVTDGGIMAEGLFAVITAAIILASYRLVERRSVLDAGLLGIAVGLAMLTRVEAALLLVVLVIPLVLTNRKIGAGRGLALIGVTILVSSVVVSPWVIRNLVTFQKPVLLSDGDGLVLLGANCPPTYYGPGIGGWGLSCTGRIAGVTGDESVKDAAARQAGLKYMEQHASRVPLVVAARVARVWEVYQPVEDATANGDDGRPHWSNIVDLSAYAFLAPLAVAGIVVLVRRGQRIFPLTALLVAVTLTAVIGWGSVRFRAPAEVVMVVLGGVAIDAVWRFTASRRISRLSVRSSGGSAVDRRCVEEPRRPCLWPLGRRWFSG